MKRSTGISSLVLSAIAAVVALALGVWDRTKRDEERCCSSRGIGGSRDCHRTIAQSPLAVKIQHDTFAILRAYVEAAPGEMTLLGTAQHDRVHNEIQIERLLLPEQFSSAGHTEVSEEALAQLLVEAVSQGVDTAHLRVWAHSHGAMEAFFSAVDEVCIQSAFPQADWVLSLVTNHAGQTKARLSLYSPVRLDIDDLPIGVGLPPDLEETIRQEVELRVHGGHDHSARGTRAKEQVEVYGTGGDGRYGSQWGYVSGGGRSDVDTRYPVYVSDS